MEEQSPEITMREDQREWFERKLADYKVRLKKQWSKEPYQPPEIFPAWYSIRVVEELLKSGKIETWELWRAIAAEHGGDIVRPDYLQNACAVIDNYTQQLLA